MIGTVRMLFLGLVLAIAGAGSAVAHHSYAMFDTSSRLTVVGTVRKLEWMNPHVWLRVTVVNENDQPVDYLFEGRSIGELMRYGHWTRKTVKPGDRISVTYAPFRDGRHGGRFWSLVLPGGRSIRG